MKKLFTLLLVALFVACAMPRTEQPQGRKALPTEVTTKNLIETVQSLVIENQKIVYYYQKQQQENELLKSKVTQLEKRVDTLEAYHKPITIPEPLEEKAFPTVKGAGKHVTGGRGGVVVKVTNLNDSGPGSLRNALIMKVPRTIVFDVSGTIKLLSAIELIKENSNFTVAGQTAPEGGITISNHLIQMGGGYNRPAQPCNNAIWRYVRFRNGRYNGQRDVREHNGVLSSGCKGLVFDHCSFSFCDDQAIAMGGDWDELTDVTIQNCTFSENATGIIIGLNPNHQTGRVSVINNLFVDQSHRTPNIGGQLQYDIINNVYFNWKSRLSNINSSTPEVNYIGNYLIEGSYTDSGSTNQVQTSTGTKPTIYTAYNYHNTYYQTPQLDDRKLWQVFVNNGNVSSSRFTTTVHPILGGYVPTTAQESYNNVLNDVGANKYLTANGFSFYQDSFDVQKINNVKNKVSTNPENKSWQLPTIPNNKRANDYDANNDGLPDALEYLLPEGKKATDLHESGYSYLEVIYLNNVDK